VVPLSELLLFAGAALLMVLTPGPNMLYLISRSICQGRRAGVVSLLGVVSGFLVHMLAAAAGLTALFMGFLTNVLNPKIAIFYLSIFPQFVTPERGSVFVQSIQLGFTQIVVSFSINLCITLSAARIAAWFARSPGWLEVQRYVMGTVLAALAVRLALEQRRGG